MKPAVRVNDLAGRIVEQSIGNRPDAVRDIHWLAHALLRKEALRDALFVNLLHFRDHVRADHPRTNLEDPYAMRREAGCPDRHRHTEPRLRNAVFRAIHRCRVRRDRCNENDSPRAAFHHLARGELGQEVRTFQIDGDQLVEAFLACFEHVLALARRDAGVVDQEVDAAELLFRESDEPRAIVSRGDIARENRATGFFAQRFSSVEPAAIGGYDIVRARELFRDAAANAAARSRNNRYRFQRRTG